MKNSCKLITKFQNDVTAQEGIEKAIKKQDEIDQQKATRQALEDNIRKLEQARSLEKKDQLNEAIAARRAVEDNAKKMKQAIALEKKDQLNEAIAARRAVEDNAKKMEQAKALKEKEKAGVFIQSSIYDALKKHNNIKKGDTISVIRRTSREPLNLVIITVDCRQELIPFHEKNYSQDFLIKSELEEADQSKEWVEVDDRITFRQYYIVSKR
jgi:hypothetical protein